MTSKMTKTITLCKTYHPYPKGEKKREAEKPHPLHFNHLNFESPDKHNINIMTVYATLKGI